MVFDADSGKTVGLEVWRIEKMEPVRIAASDNGKFHTGDCYIVLNTYEVKGRIEQDLHFWLGSESSQDERGSCAYHTVNLDDQLGGKPVQHREVQGHESSEFLGLFKKLGGIQYLEGGVESGFRKVDPNDYATALYHLKGRRNVRVLQVEVSRESLNDGDVFILDTLNTIYQWNGASANKYEKFKALEHVTKLNNEQHGAKAATVFLNSGSDDADAEEFWQLLGGKGPIKSAEEGGDDAAAVSQPAKLFRISDASGSMEVSLVGEKTLERSMLDENDAFILDTGSSVFVWVGKGANKDERKKAMNHGVEYLAQNNRPDWTPLQRVPQNGEPPAFKGLFTQWDPPRVATVTEDGKVEEPEEDLDVAALHQRQTAAEEKMVDDATGSLKIWRIENFDKVAIDEASYGQFYQGDSYIVLYSYKNGNKDAWIIYFWQGRDSSTDEKASSALLATQLDDELGGDPVQVRVVQGQEPNHFLALFKGKMVVHEGGIASAFKNKDDKDSYDTDGISLFHVRGTTALNTRAVQVAEVPASLNSGDCFVLLTEPTMFVWHGVGANDFEKECADNIAAILKYNRETVSVAEGSEPDAFWEALGGKGEYPKTKALAEAIHDPRLFCISNNTGKLRVEEIYNYSQEDLLNDDVMLLDAYSEVFVWVGHDSNQKEKDTALQVALDYVKAAPDGRSPQTPIYKISAGGEPPNFTCHFLGWNPSKASDFSDPYAAKLAAMGGGDAAPRGSAPTEQKVELVTADSIGFRKFEDSADIEDLRNKTVPNVDTANRHLYLTDAVFQETFGCNKAEFGKMPGWKQKQKKQAVGLF